MYIKIPVKKRKLEPGSAVTVYEYDDMDSLEFEKPKMNSNEKYLFCKVKSNVKLGKKTKKITKTEYNKIK